VIQTRCKVAEL